MLEFLLYFMNVRVLDIIFEFFSVNLTYSGVSEPFLTFCDVNICQKQVSDCKYFGFDVSVRFLYGFLGSFQRFCWVRFPRMGSR